MSNKHEYTDSSSIKHIDYHAPDTLEICFTSGHTYHYPNVPKDVYDTLKKAASPGSFFHKSIKNRWEGKKI